MSDTPLVVIRTFLNRIDAELAKGALEAAEIDAMVAADDAGGLRPSFWVLRGVRLLVREEDIERAEEVLGPGSNA